MPELRFHPLLGTYTMVAANRQQRPHMPKDWCPFCPGSGKVPDDFDVYLYKNDFPALSTQPEKAPIHDFYSNAEAYGMCEVVLYTPKHRQNFYELDIPHIAKVVKLWRQRQNELSKDEKIKYIYPFENKGEEVGVTMPHPHGQIYAYSWLPLKVKTELENAKKYFENTGKNLVEEVTKIELKEGRRIVFENAFFVAYIPYFTDYPYGVYIAPKTNIAHIGLFSDEECEALAETLKMVTGAFDFLFNKSFPYMMVTHQTPQHLEEFKEAHLYYGYHLEFYPPLRDADKIKWYASSEMGAWAAANVKDVDETTQEMRDALQKFIDSQK